MDRVADKADLICYNDSMNSVCLSTIYYQFNHPKYSISYFCWA